MCANGVVAVEILGVATAAAASLASWTLLVAVAGVLFAFRVVGVVVLGEGGSINLSMVDGVGCCSGMQNAQYISFSLFNR
jgi:hypothetical protein